jgi:LPXTG-site transpeptidase (sortase) family protein
MMNSSRALGEADAGNQGQATPTNGGLQVPTTRPRRFPVHPAKLLAIGLILFGLAILVYPFYPMLRYRLVRPAPRYPYQTQLPSSVTESNGHLPAIGNTLPSESRLVIPKIGVDMPIVEGPDERSLFRGSWRLPQTSTPDQGGNTVLTVHRFQYLAGPNTLALADKLEAGDMVLVYWKTDSGIQEYDYQIERTFLVTPDQTEILQNTPEPQLTLFTCAPMFSTSHRLVIEGRPIAPTPK